MNKQLLENPLLLVIDMQNVYSNGQKWECSNFNRSLNQIKKLLESNTEEKIIFTKYIASDEPQGIWKNYNIENSDVNYMKSMPGVGAKTASQIILDLKGKLVAREEIKVNEKLNDAVETLKSLGFKSLELKNIIKELSKEDLSTEQYVKRALAMLAK